MSWDYDEATYYYDNPERAEAVEEAERLAGYVGDLEYDHWRDQIDEQCRAGEPIMGRKVA